MSVAVDVPRGQHHARLAGLPTMHRFRLCLLQGFELADERTVIPLAMTGQRLLAFLALAKRPVRRVSVGGILWPEACEERAQASLRSTLWRFHRDGLEVVLANGEFLALAGGISVDVRQMAESARRLHGPDDAGTLTDPEVFFGDLLPDWGEEWVLVERERLRQIRLHALEELCVQLGRAGRFADAVNAALAAVIDEPLRDSAQRALISAYLAEGNQYEALRQFDAYRERLHRELGLEPSPQLRSLMATTVTRR